MKPDGVMSSVNGRPLVGPAPVRCVPLPVDCVPLLVSCVPLPLSVRTTATHVRTTTTQRAYRCLITRYHANSGAFAFTLHDLFAVQAGSSVTHDATATMCEWIPLNSGRYHYYSWHVRVALTVVPPMINSIHIAFIVSLDS